MLKKLLKNISFFFLYLFFIVAFYVLINQPIIAQEIFKNISIFKDIPYDVINDFEPYFTSLDIYTPLSGEQLPVIIFVHGGTWVLGNKGIFNEKIKSFVEVNLVYVSVNYRLSPNVRHPSHAEDVAKAITWIYEHISEYGGNPKNLFLMGHSAGGHLSALIALDEHYLQDLGYSNEIIRGVIGLDSAAYHLPSLFKKEPENTFLFEMAFGNRIEIWEEASPINYTEKIKNVPPFLLLYAGDRVVTKEVNTAFYKSLIKATHQASLYFAQDKTHVSIERELGKPGDDVFQIIIHFIQNNLS